MLSLFVEDCKVVLGVICEPFNEGTNKCKFKV